MCNQEFNNNDEKELLKEMQESNIKILSVEESIQKLIKEKKSICRFGDGELDIILGKDLGFQKSNLKLAKMLENILKMKQDHCFIGIPDAINHFDNITDESREFWIKNMERVRKIWLKYLRLDMHYLSANVTRLYIRYKDKSKCVQNFAALKSLWKEREIVICEGEQTRIGVGNDILNEAKSIKRIICPSENAFDKYEQILSVLKKEDKNKLILIALGPTATLLAFELSKLGFQALDVGHFDIEYEWFLRGCTKKEIIHNKYTNELEGGNNSESVNDKEYLKQIKTVIK